MIEKINKNNQNAINDNDHFLINKPETTFIWKSEDAALYKDKLSEVHCSYIEDKLNEAESGDEVVSVDIINSILEDLSKDVASDSGMSKPVTAKANKSRRRSLPHKPWYNSNSESTHRNMLGYKNKYRKLKNAENLFLLKQSCKIYKRNINKAYGDYENELIRKIHKLQSENPRENWKLIQGKRGPNSIPNIPLKFFEDILKTWRPAHRQILNTWEKDLSQIKIQGWMNLLKIRIK